VATAGVAAGSREQRLSLRCKPAASVDGGSPRRQRPLRRLASRG